MSVTVYFANVAKKRNSTLQGTFTTSYDCVMKAPTSLDRPTFLVSAETMDYNAAKMGDRYYFIDDVVSVRNGQWEVSCILDVLATYKADILASTQYVCYSSYNSSNWLPDTRIPVLRSTEYSENLGMDIGLYSSSGFYVLTVVGKNGCVCYGVPKITLEKIIEEIQDWVDDDFAAIMAGTYDPVRPVNYQWGDEKEAIQSLAYMLTQAGCVGNAYQNAPQMIRSCIWVPLKLSMFETGSAQPIYLGNYDTGYAANQIRITPGVVTETINIPWKYSDWRRSVCETVYIRLPYAGLIEIGADSIASETSLKVETSIVAVDGTMAYRVMTGTGKTIGYYAGSCSAPYALGINQRTGAGEVVQTAIAGISKTIATATDVTLNPMSIAGGIAGAALEGVNAAYQTANVALSTHPSCIGSMGGAASSGLDQKVGVIVLSHEIAIEPSAMGATMGRPTMAPMSLSSLTGFCQCANAHISAAAQAQELDAIDAYLNSGFFIE